MANTPKKSVAPNGGAADEHEVSLSRTLGPFTVTMMGVGGMIGAGIFALTGIAAGKAGPAVIVVFLLNGLVTLLTAFAYAELGSAFPRAGGGYVWIKEGLGGANGFLGGWMSWFGYVVAGALYAIAFGGFAADSWAAMGLPMGGWTSAHIGPIFTVGVLLVFSAFNFFGAKEAGAMGNIITVTKIIILGAFVIFGVVVMFSSGTWEGRFTHDFMPNGISGVFIAMGLTFIAFEGYEIIAQSGEEIIDPKRNIPRGIFISIAIAVSVYVLVGIVAIGATVVPAGVSVHTFLGQQKELAIVSVARQIFPFGSGGALMLISGLAATMSALNVTLYSASRVAFAMGREHNLPPAFSRIHSRFTTPYVAVLVSGAMMVAAGLTLPIETAATAGGIMFLLMFIQVNLAVMTLRQKNPDARRGFTVPFFPLPVVIAVTANAALVLYMVTYNPTAVWMAFVWIVLGLLAYTMYFEKHETTQKPKAIVHEEAVGKQDYTVLVAVRERRESRVLGWFAAAVAKARKGGVLAVNMLEVPPPLSLGEGRQMVDTAKSYFEAVSEEAKQRKTPLHTLIMISRAVGPALMEIVRERQGDIAVLGWTGEKKRGRLFGHTSDELLANPPTDIALVRAAARAKETYERILVPVISGANSRLALELACDIGRVVAGRKHACVTLLHVVRGKEALSAGWDAEFADLREEITYGKLETKLIQGSSIANTIIEEAENHDLMIFGASDEPIFERILTGSISRRLLRDAKPTTVMVKRRQPVLSSLLRRTVLSNPARAKVKAQK